MTDALDSISVEDVLAETNAFYLSFVLRAVREYNIAFSANKAVVNFRYARFAAGNVSHWAKITNSMSASGLDLTRLPGATPIKLYMLRAEHLVVEIPRLIH